MSPTVAAVVAFASDNCAAFGSYAGCSASDTGACAVVCASCCGSTDCACYVVVSLAGAVAFCAAVSPVVVVSFVPVVGASTGATGVEAFNAFSCVG